MGVCGCAFANNCPGVIQLDKPQSNNTRAGSIDEAAALRDAMT